MTRSPLRRPLAAAAALAVVLALGACAPFVATIRPTVLIEGTVTLQAGVRIVRVPQDRPAGGIVVRPAGARSFTIPPGHYPPTRRLPRLGTGATPRPADAAGSVPRHRARPAAGGVPGGRLSQSGPTMGRPVVGTASPSAATPPSTR